jgi:hypothetical protein
MAMLPPAAMWLTSMRPVIFLLRIQLVVFTRLNAPFTSEMRIALPHKVKQAGQENGGEAPEHDGRQHAGELLALFKMQNLRVTHGERNRPLTHSAAHDRNDDVEEGIARTEAQQRAYTGSDQCRRHGSGRQRHKDLQKTTDQHGAIHAENRAHDDAGDEEVEEVGVLGKIRDRLHDHRRNPSVKGEERRDEGREDRGAADVLHEGNALADFRADKATHGQHGEHRTHVTGRLARRGKLAGGDERTEHDRQQHQHRHGENAHAQLHEFPPAVRPEAGVRYSRGRRGGRTGFSGHRG